MNLVFLIRLAVLNTFKKRLRAFLAIGGIALTSTVIVVLFGVQMGLQQLIDNEIKNGTSLDVITVNMRDVQEIKFGSEQIGTIQSISGVAQISQSVGLYGTATYHGISLNAPVYAVDPSYFTMSPAAVTEGSTEEQPKGNSMVISTKALEVFAIDPSDAVGKSITLRTVIAKEYAERIETAEKELQPVSYKIVGVIERGDLPVLYTDIEQVKEAGVTNVSQLNIRLTSPDRAPVVREAIEKLGYQTTSVQDTIEQINQLFDVIRNILIIFGIIVFIITVSAAFTVISLTLMEETRQIGFLRVTGLMHSEVERLFIIQSIIITFLGAFFGCIAGTVAGLILNGYARAISESTAFTGEVSIFTIPALQVIIILTLSIVVGWLVGSIPAKRANRINPLEELQL